MKNELSSSIEIDDEQHRIIEHIKQHIKSLLQKMNINVVDVFFEESTIKDDSDEWYSYVILVPVSTEKIATLNQNLNGYLRSLPSNIFLKTVFRFSRKV